MKKITLKHIHMIRTEKATRKSWEIHPFSGNKSPLNVQAEYTDLEFAKINEKRVVYKLIDQYLVNIKKSLLFF